MDIQKSTNRFLCEIWKEIRAPLVNITTGAILFVVTVLLFKVGGLVLNWFFTEESWFFRYLDIMAVSALILSYLTYFILSLVVHCHQRLVEIRNKKEVINYE